MPSVYQLKAYIQEALRPIASILAMRGIAPNHVTIFAMYCSVLYGIVLCFGPLGFWLLLPVFLAFRLALNVIDGIMAIEHGMKTPLGTALNELGTVVSDVALFIPFIFFAFHAAWVIAFFILMSVVNEMCGVIAFMICGERLYDGPMGSGDRAIATGVMGLLIGVGVISAKVIGVLFLILSLLVIWSSINRIRSAIALKEVQS
ncbi:MAG: hypothetical protein ACTHOO_01650 [Alcanivorax sp.]